MNDQGQRPATMANLGLQHSAFIARSVGIVAIASGFVMGMYGLDHPDSVWLRTSLGLIATGMLAQGYALYCSLRRMRNQKRPPRE
jgi:hypothetical protein